MNVVYQEETLKNVIRSVTRNLRSILLTALLALIIIYHFSIIGYLFFQDDYLVEVDPNIKPASGFSNSNGEMPLSPSLDLPISVVDSIKAQHKHNKQTNAYLNLQVNDSFHCYTDNCTGGGVNGSVILEMMNQTFDDHSQDRFEEEEYEEEDGEVKERACDSLLMCMITTLNHGLRNGGGIGDVLRSPSSKEHSFVPRVVYDLLFFFIVIIIILNLIFGVIIDTFADLRSEKQQKEEILKNTCFICGEFWRFVVSLVTELFFFRVTCS